MKRILGQTGVGQSGLRAAHKAAATRQQKIVLLIGPPRSGKGTTMAVLSQMLGKHNVANSSLASLGGRLGLEPLVGKLAALIDEGHIGKFTDSSLVL